MLQGRSRSDGFLPLFLPYSPCLTLSPLICVARPVKTGRGLASLSPCFLSCVSSDKFLSLCLPLFSLVSCQCDGFLPLCLPLSPLVSCSRLDRFLLLCLPLSPFLCAAGQCRTGVSLVSLPMCCNLPPLSPLVSLRMCCKAGQGRTALCLPLCSTGAFAGERPAASYDSRGLVKSVWGLRRKGRRA